MIIIKGMIEEKRIAGQPCNNKLFLYLIKNDEGIDTTYEKLKEKLNNPLKWRIGAINHGLIKKKINKLKIENTALNNKL